MIPLVRVRAKPPVLRESQFLAVFSWNNLFEPVKPAG